MDELISVDPNEIESAPNDEIVILKDVDEVERFRPLNIKNGHF